MKNSARSASAINPVTMEIAIKQLTINYWIVNGYSTLFSGMFYALYNVKNKQQYDVLP